MCFLIFAIAWFYYCRLHYKNKSVSLGFATADFIIKLCFFVFCWFLFSGWFYYCRLNYKNKFSFKK